ncbi:MAG: hypothetical protein JJU00_07540 [Opitutales bacterium]|nr:hypothetical protein [Opitutales bacterium]
MESRENNERSDAMDAHLDELLRRPSVVARGDFAARTLARLRSDETALDAGLDRMLHREAVFARPDFADRVFARLADEDVAARQRVVSGFRGWLSPVVAAAALLLISIGFLARPESVPYETAFAEDSVPSLSEIAADPSIDPEMARLFALAEGLGSEARALLDNPDVSSWLAMAE